jgi:hypothetical protein
MVWVAVFALVCMTAVGVALVGITTYLLYSIARRLFHGAAELLRRERREAAKPVTEQPEPVAHT